jgi:hypothetical protein
MSRDLGNITDVGSQVGAIDASTRIKSGTEGIHQVAINIPTNYNKPLGVPSDYGNVGLVEENAQPNFIEGRDYGTEGAKREDVFEKLDIDKDYEIGYQTVIGGQGISGVPVEGDVRTNHGGVTYEIRKKKFK